MLKRLLLVFLFASPVFAESPLSGRVIALDPGHGTLDFDGRIINSGKISRNGFLQEHRINFDIAQKLGKLIEDAGGQVIYTRTPYDYWRQASSVTEDNKARALLANELNAEVFLAIHCDWDPRSRIHGATTYYKTAESRRLGESIHQKLIRATKASDRQLKKDHFTVLDQSTMPGVLIEAGFLSNRVEGKNLATPEYQAKVAEAIAEGLSVYFAN